MALTTATTFRGAPGRSTHHRRGRTRRPAWPTARSTAAGRASPSSVGLPELVGFAIGAGVMATALAALEAGLAGNDRVRRLARDGGVRAELERAAADHGWRLPLPRSPLAEETGSRPSDGTRQKSWASS